MEETNFNQFEALLLNKEYAQLTKQEQLLVAKYCQSAEEFNQMKKIARDAAYPLESIPNPAIKADLLHHMRSKQPIPVSSSFLYKKIPLWALMTSIILLASFFYFFKTKEIIIQEFEKTVIKRDTIYQPLRQIDTIYIRIPVPSKKKPIAKTVQTPEEKHPKQQHEIKAIKPSFVLKEILPKQSPKGLSLKQAADLKQFIARTDPSDE